MLEPNGIKDSEVDLVFAGASSARFTASVRRGRCGDSTAPFNFYAATAGFNIVGRTADYVTDLPQNGTVVNRNWAAAHMSSLKKFLSAFNKGRLVRGRAQPRRSDKNLGRHRQSEARRGGKELRVFPQGWILEPTGSVSRAKLRAVVNVLVSLGDLPNGINIDQLLLPGVTEVTD